MCDFYRSVAFCSQNNYYNRGVLDSSRNDRQTREGQDVVTFTLFIERELALFKFPRSKGAMQIPAASTPPFDVLGSQIIVVITVAVHNRWNRPNKGPCCDSQLVV